MRDVLAYLVVGVGGVIVASVGAVAYRAYPYFGVAACILLVLLAAVFARTWLGWGGIATFAATWATMTAVWAQEGPGGSVLLAQDALGLTWLIGASAAIVLAALVPVRLLVGARGPA